MLPFSFEITGMDLSKMDMQRAKRLANAAAGDYWHRKLAWRHWASGAAGRYNYKPRSRKYEARKRKAAQRGKALAGGAVPLLYSGTMRQLLLGAAVNMASPAYIRLRMKGPRYVHMVPKRQNMPNLGGEATALAADEGPLLRAAWAEHMKAILKAVWEGRQNRERIG